MYPLAIYVVIVALVLIGARASVRFRWAERCSASVRPQLTELSDSIAVRLPASARYLAGPIAAITIVVILLGAMVSVMWPLGVALKHTQSWYDIPVLDFFTVHRAAWWSSVNEAVTRIGDPPAIEVAGGVAAVVFPFLRKRRRWVPLVVFPMAYATELYFQSSLRDLVNRRPAAGSLDSWPAGGVGPMFLIFGLMAYFFLQSSQAGYRLRVILWATLGLVVATEAYTRVYLQKHWASDVMPGGLLFGAVLLFTWASAAWLLDRGTETTAPPPEPVHVDETEARSDPISVADR